MNAGTISAELPRRSTFVTVLAWVFIVLAGFACFIGVLQALALVFIMPPAKFWNDPGAARGLEQMPPVARFWMQHIMLFFVLMWTIFIATLAAAIGLLKRRNRARIYFLGLMVFGIAWQWLGIWLQLSMLANPPFPEHAPPDFVRTFEGMRWVIGIGSTLMALGLSVLFGWIMRRLWSPAIKAEFAPTL